MFLVDAWHEEKVEQIAHAYLASTPGRKPAPGAARVASGARRNGAAGPSQLPALHHQALVSQQEISAYARRIARYRAAFQAHLNGQS